jgi:hypothetical protein
MQNSNSTWSDEERGNGVKVAAMFATRPQAQRVRILNFAF